MPRASLLLGLIVARCVLGADAPRPRDAPVYTAASIVNAADNLSGALAPNTIATIYGANLAYSTIGLTASDVRNGVLPFVLGSSETEVFVGDYPADLYYVSPTQINFLVPPNLLPLPRSVWVVIDGLRGPIIPLTILPAAPALFQLDPQNVVATNLKGDVLTSTTPAHPGDIVVLYATGLGATVPDSIYGQLPTAAASLAPGANLQVLLDGDAVDPSAILYAGIAPGNAGLYQINLALPASTATNPQIQLMMGAASSIGGVHLPVAP
jgi:uncharacterized protein (TIGR03437 family)